jgi:DivIVA domain-containing protein
MALSVTRPDPSSPASVAEATFPTARRGFDQAEVRDLLRAVAAELGRLQERERFLERELRTARTSGPIDELPADEATLTRLLGEETARVLTTARESAAQIRQKAEEAAAQLVREAADEAQRLRADAEIEAARRRNEATAEAEAEIALAKQQGREMVSEARAYRERVLSELARRREMARQQIDELVEGRDRLLQVFERARLVAVDIVADLAPLGEPEEYVDLSPTTGPVPIMVPTAARPATRPAPAAEPAPAVEAPAAVEVAAETEQPEPDAEADVDLGSPTDRVEQIVPVEQDATADAGDTGAEADRGLVEEPVAGETVPEEEPSAADLEVGDEVVEAPDVAVEMAEAAGSEPEAVVETDEDHHDGEGVEEDEATAEPVVLPAAERTNVVALFPGEDGRRDVHGLFERLRAETASVAGAEATETTASTATVTTATATTATADAAPATAVAFAVEDAEPAAAASEDAAPSAFEQRDAELVPLIVASARKLKRVLADEQNDVLDLLRRAEPITSIDELLPASAEHVARYAEAITQELTAAAAAGVASVGDAADGDRARQATGPDALAPAIEVLRADLLEPFRLRLARAVDESGGDHDDLTRRVRSLYREWKTQQIDDHLDDVVRMAHGTAILRAVAPGTPMCWLVDPNGPACPDAEDNWLGGAVPAGEPYPTGHVCAPAHAGCRCVLSVVGN